MAGSGADHEQDVQGVEPGRGRDRAGRGHDHGRRGPATRQNSGPRTRTRDSEFPIADGDVHPIVHVRHVDGPEKGKIERFRVSGEFVPTYTAAHLTNPILNRHDRAQSRSAPMTLTQLFAHHRSPVCSGAGRVHGQERDRRQEHDADPGNVLIQARDGRSWSRPRTLSRPSAGSAHGGDRHQI